jgi:hypothetical protein
MSHKHLHVTLVLLYLFKGQLCFRFYFISQNFQFLVSRYISENQHSFALYRNLFSLLLLCWQLVPAGPLFILLADYHLQALLCCEQMFNTSKKLKKYGLFRQNVPLKGFSSIHFGTVLSMSSFGISR